MIICIIITVALLIFTFELFDFNFDIEIEYGWYSRDYSKQENIEFYITPTIMVNSKLRTTSIAWLYFYLDFNY